MSNTDIYWDAIFAILQEWHAQLRSSGTELPSVSTLALEAAAGKSNKDTKQERDAEKSPSQAWIVLVSTLISLRTKDEVTLASSRRLLAHAPTPEALLDLEQEEIARLIYPAGFYRTKAANLLKIADILIRHYEGRVPDTIEALLALPGIGRKTANLVLSEGFGKDAICVDIHVHRICNRAGWVDTKTPEETETALRDQLPLKYWRPINWLLVSFGQHVCRPQSPFCSRCPLAAYCLRRGVSKNR
ncbi:endonuclease III [Gracilinema caldarium]|uniref:endonuclease III domain-containing protein n=1 Tax=Gracilinema caldarium TaxID=215591 RepID=UPI0026EB8284|nr:endonuclease III [Gracilinema caldarium]